MKSILYLSYCDFSNYYQYFLKKINLYMLERRSGFASHTMVSVLMAGQRSPDHDNQQQQVLIQVYYTV